MIRVRVVLINQLKVEVLKTKLETVASHLINCKHSMRFSLLKQVLTLIHLKPNNKNFWKVLRRRSLDGMATLTTAVSPHNIFYPEIHEVDLDAAV